MGDDKKEKSTYSGLVDHAAMVAGIVAHQTKTSAADWFACKIRTEIGTPTEVEMFAAECFKNKHFAVFGLGSSAYVDLAAFGVFMDSALGRLGGVRLTELGIGDEMKNQQASFQTWLTKAFKTAVKLHDLPVSDERMEAILGSINATKEYKWKVDYTSKTKSVNTALASLHHQEVFDLTLQKRTRLHKEPGEANTLLLDFTFPQRNEDGAAAYEAGDHLGLCPSNRAVDVAFMKEHLLDIPSLTHPLVLLETTGQARVWKEADDFPQYLCFDDILNYVVDLSRLPSQEVLRMMLRHAATKKDQEELKMLVDDSAKLEKWEKKCNTFCDTLREFPSVQLPSAEVGSVLEYFFVGNIAVRNVNFYGGYFLTVSNAGDGYNTDDPEPAVQHRIGNRR